MTDDRFIHCFSYQVRSFIQLCLALVRPHPAPLFSLLQVIIGGSITRNVHYFNAVTHCFCCAIILIKLVFIHLGLNDTALQQSDFTSLFNLLKSYSKTIFISDPISTGGHGSGSFRILSPRTWLQFTCMANEMFFFFYMLFSMFFLFLYFLSILIHFGTVDCQMTVYCSWSETSWNLPLSFPHWSPQVSSLI